MGMQHRSFNGMIVGKTDFAPAIGVITQDRMPDRSEMDPDLMRAAGLRVNLDERRGLAKTL